jgi:hypothetical protein
MSGSVIEITPALIEQYRSWRKETISRRKQRVTPASINRELSWLKRMFNVAKKGLITLEGGVPIDNPVASITLERENNARDRVLSHEEFDQRMAVSPHI